MRAEGGKTCGRSKGSRARGTGKKGLLLSGRKRRERT